ncbi:MAG: TRAP transporter TatT component family protein [Pseudomonadota bacterium]
MSEQRPLILRSNRFLGSALIERGLVTAEDLEVANEKLLETIQAGDIRGASLLNILIYEQKALDEALLLDSLVEGDPKNEDTLATAADLYAAYASVFARDPARSKTLSARALDYAERAACIEMKYACSWPEARFEAFSATLEEIDNDEDATISRSYALASLAYIRAHSDDWAALARLPHIEALLLAVLAEQPDEDAGALYNYLGILNSLRGPGLGDDTDKARRYFEKAIQLTGGQDLAIKVEFARGYARSLYDRELHDRLLNEVVAADPVVDGLTLTNTLAQQDAALLLASADDYF